MNLIDAQGQVRLGRFGRPIERLNLEDEQARRGLLRGPALEQVEFFGVLAPEVVFGATLRKSGYLSSSTVHFWDVPSGRGMMRTRRLPGLLGVQQPLTPEIGTSTFPAPGLHLVASALGNARRLQITSRRFHAELTFAEASDEPLRMCAPRPGGWQFSRLLAGQAVQGHLSWRNQRIELGEGALALHSWRAGFPSTERTWRWSGAAARLADGRRLGLSLSDQGPGESENALWLEGTLHPLPTVQYQVDPDNLLSPWQIQDAEQRLSLTFQPALAAAQDRYRLWPFAYDHRQIFGHYSGRLATPAGLVLEITDVPGLAEQGYARG